MENIEKHIHQPERNVFFGLLGHEFIVYKDIPAENASICETMLDLVAHGKDGYEPNTADLISKIVKERDIVMDIGSSFGYFTMWMARLVGKNGKVIAIDPQAKRIEYLLYNTILNGYEDRVNAIRGAAWDEDKQIESPFNATVKENVETVVIDNLLEKLGINELNFVKIDVDGAEPWVLRGMQKTIQKSPNLQMIIEFYPKYLEAAGSSGQELKVLLDKDFICEPIEGDYGEGYTNLYCKRKVN